MAPAKGDDVDGDEKRTRFRCLDAARCLVAVTVTVLIFAVIVYAVTVVLRPGDLSLWVVGGSISVEQTGPTHKLRAYDVGGAGELTFSFTLRAVNPSGRVRIYFTGVIGLLSGRNSSAAMNAFFKTDELPSMALGQQSTVDTNVQASMSVFKPSQEYYFKALANGTTIADAMLKLNGTRIVENYSGNNMTAVRAVYYCPGLTVGGEDDSGTTPFDVPPCTENPPTST